MGTESRLTEDVWRTWLEPFHAIKLLLDAGLDDRRQAVDWLKARLGEGALKASGWHPDFDDDLNVTEEFIASYSIRVRRAVGGIPWDHDFWVSGNFAPPDEDLSLRVSIQHTGCQYDLVGTRFDPVPIRAFCERYSQPTAGNAMPQQTKPLARRGAKRKDWWDHLWIEMIRRIGKGTLKPASQAELERILYDYAVLELNADPGESTLKPMAANLFKFLNEVAGEIGEN